MLKSFAPRPYQEEIFTQASQENTLVVLPTGLGKTAIAMLLAAKRLVQYPHSKILFLAPTKPLVEQQLASFKEKFMFGDDDFALFTGATAPDKRHKLWSDSRLIFSTPQTIENDVLSSKISLRDVSLLIIDEAHRATGDYAYVYLAGQYTVQASHDRILALTASPGTNKEQIEEIMHNVHCPQITYRKLDDPQIKPYIQGTDVSWKQVMLTDRHKQASSYLEKAYSLRLDQLKEYKFVTTKSLSKTQLIKLQSQLFKQIAGNPESSVLHGVSLCAQCLKLQHAIELVETQTIHASLEYLEGILQQARSSKSKAVSQLAQDSNLISCLAILRELSADNKEHPKVDMLIHDVYVLTKQKKKCIIFTQFRDTAMHIEKKLAQFAKPTIFFGQAKKKGVGLSQKDQKKIIDAFRNDEYDCLIATSVAEEGLDIPSVDAVYFFEPIPSAIRSVQRRGRTGRHSRGAVTVYVTKDTRDEVNRWVSFHKEKRMYSVLDQLQHNPILPKKDTAQQTLQAFATDVKIIADFREKGSSVLKSLQNKGSNLELKQLQVGDFLLSKDVCVEYKTYEDFAASVIDNRLLVQLRSLTQYTKPLLVIEGDIDEHTRQLNSAALYGMLSAVAVSYRIPIIQTKNPTQTAELLMTIAKREQTDSKDSFTFHAAKPLDDKTLQEYIISSLPGIGGSLAKQLLKHFGSVQQILEASQEDLKKVSLIGEKKAQEIRRILDLTYKKE
jgi:Fanconi anemia group M protein